MRTILEFHFTTGEKLSDDRTYECIPRVGDLVVYREGQDAFIVDRIVWWDRGYSVPTVIARQVPGLQFHQAA